MGRAHGSFLGEMARFCFLTRVGVKRALGFLVAVIYEDALLFCVSSCLLPLGGDFGIMTGVLVTTLMGLPQAFCGWD